MNRWKLVRKVTLATMKPVARPQSHANARSKSYPRFPDVERYQVPDHIVTWDISFPDYEPVDFTAPVLCTNPDWADQDVMHTDNIPEEKYPKWNSLDGKIDRRSHMGQYNVVDNLPRNPVGRTGTCSRGLLGRWGPNHAADPIVTRWKRNARQQILIHERTKTPLLEFIAIQRKDSGEWAIPGGMVDAGETVSTTLKREFSEEAMNFLEATPDERKKIRANVRALFSSGQEVYRGYVDDPRNTDNAWMETVAVNFHDQTGESVAKFQLHAGDDAVGVKWHDLHSGIQLYATHIDFLEKVAKRLKAHW